MLKINNLSISYHSKNIIKKLNLKIEDGSIIIICGSSGAGKTTLLHALSGIIPGIIKAEVNGSIESDGDSTIVFQNPHYYSFANIVLEELSFYQENLNIPPDSIIENVFETAKFFSLENKLLKKITDLSAGEKERVSISSAVMTKSKIFFFDEPLSLLDETGKKIFLELVLKLKSEKKICFISEHLVEPLLKISDNLLFLNNSAEYSYYNLPLSENDENDLFEKGIRTKKLYNGHRAGYKSEEIILKTENLSFGYNSQNKILNNLNFEIHKGNITAISGLNGTGKTTLLKLIAGLLKYDTGKILCSEKIAYIDQDPDRMLFENSVYNEINPSKKYNENKIDMILNELNISHLKHNNPLLLSLGEKHRVSIAAALITNPSLILIDEPAAGLDYKNLSAFFEILHSLTISRNITVMISSNDKELIKSYSSKIFHIENGEIHVRT
ncbi:ABC transporter ATP-binding protein [Candidatus Dependentiae bacterium]|nr:ABC transporter ATP-binding protein [Candidatus Dependentiae bacterium]